MNYERHIHIPKSAGVYKITCTSTGKFYIGSAANMRGRWTRHLSNLRVGDHPNIHLQRAWNKYGEEVFVFEVIEESDSFVEREQYWLDKLKPFGKIGFNIATVAQASRTGAKLSDETKEKIALTKRGKHLSLETREKMSESRTGGKRSPETRRKMSEAQKGISKPGHKHSEESIAKLRSHRRTDEQRERISNGLKGRSFTDEHRMNISQAAKNRRKILGSDQINEIDSLISEGKSNSVIAKVFNVSTATISRIRRGLF